MSPTNDCFAIVTELLSSLFFTYGQLIASEILGRFSFARFPFFLIARTSLFVYRGTPQSYLLIRAHQVSTHGQYRRRPHMSPSASFYKLYQSRQWDFHPSTVAKSARLALFPSQWNKDVKLLSHAWAKRSRAGTSKVQTFPDTQGKTRGLYLARKVSCG